MIYQVGKKQCSNSGRKRNDIDPLESDLIVQLPSPLEFLGSLTPPPLWNFQFPPWLESGYFLEPHILSPPLQNFHVVLPTKKCLLCFLSLALNLCPPFSHWASLRLLSLFLCVSLALYSKLVDVTINLSVILSKTRIQRQFPISSSLTL